jgi:hypothetical protein
MSLNTSNPPEWIRSIFTRMGKPMTPEDVAQFDLITQSDIARLRSALEDSPTGPNRVEFRPSETGIVSIRTFRNGSPHKRFTIALCPKLVKRAKENHGT